MKKLVVLLSVITGAAQASDDIDKANCAAEWPGDYKMQGYCLEQNAKATQRLATLLEEIGDEGPMPEDMQQVLADCKDEWPGEVGGYDYPMVVYCFETQLEAYKELQR